MIMNNLAVLLAERQLKITKVANDTHISRTTLTALHKNESKMIQLDTVNTLCKYLETDPGNFFEFVPYDFDFYVDILDDFVYEPGEAPETHEVEAYVNVKGTKENFSFSYKGIFIKYDPYNFHLDLGLINEKEEQRAIDFFLDLPINVWTKIESNFSHTALEEGKKWCEKNPQYQVNVSLINKN